MIQGWSQPQKNIAGPLFARERRGGRLLNTKRILEEMEGGRRRGS